MRLQPWQPFPRRGNGLYRGCLFALAPGWPHGAIAPNPGICPERDAITQSQGHFSSSIDPTHFKIFDAGRMLDSRGVSNEQFTWAQIGSYWALQQSFTAAVLFRPTTLDTNPPSFCAVWSLTDNPADFLLMCWSIHSDSNAIPANSYRGQFQDPALTYHFVDSGVAPLLTRTDLVIVRYDRVVAGTLEIWVNGILRASIATTAAVRNSAPAPLGSTKPNVSSDSTFAIGMLGYWNRALARSEMAALWSDPFAMWHRRPPERLVGFA